MRVNNHNPAPHPWPLDRVRRRAAGALLLAILLVAGCGHGEPSRLHLSPSVARPQPGAVIFLVDGLPPRFVEQGCAAGWLPHIAARFGDGGTRVRRATTCVPSITYAAITTILTGVSPGTHQVVGNRWFDPAAALYRDYATIRHYRSVNEDFAAPTICELIQPAASVSIQAAHHRGATENVANWAQSGVAWFFEDFTAVDKMTASALDRVIRWANSHRHWPTIVTFYFPGLDTIGHIDGPESAEFYWAMWHVDHQIGRVCAWLEREGLLDTTYLVLASDHGMLNVNPQQHIDLLSLVRDGWGRTVLDHSLQDGSEAWRRTRVDRFDTVVVHTDGRAATIQFRSAGGWSRRPTPTDVEAILTNPPDGTHLWDLAGVELVAYLAAEDEAVLRSAAGEARIRRRGSGSHADFAYTPVTADVLGYADHADLSEFVAAGYHSSRAWLAATADQTLPDVVPHIVPLLHVRRAGQVVLFAQPGYSFVAENGGHGGLDRDERLATLYFAGPGIERGGTIEAARTVDIVPTLLALLGIEPATDNAFEGQALFEPGGFRSALPEETSAVEN